MKTKYYRLNLKNDNKIIERIYLYEYKKLSEKEYHNSFALKRKNCKHFKPEKKDYLTPTNSHLSYDGYNYKKFNYFVTNNNNIDGFDYDKFRGLMVYGTTSIYVEQRENGKYFDIATGQNIYIAEDNSQYIEISSKEDLEKMRKDILFINEHFDIYKQALSCISNRIFWDHFNKIKALNKYFDEKFKSKRLK